MAQFTVKQPNGQLAVFSEIVDNFIACNMDEARVVAWYRSRGLSESQAYTKMQAGVDDLNLFTKEPDPSGQYRWKYCTDLILEIHGRDAFDETMNTMGVADA